MDRGQAIVAGMVTGILITGSQLELLLQRRFEAHDRVDCTGRRLAQRRVPGQLPRGV